MAVGRPRKSAQEKLIEGSRAKIQYEVFAPHGVPFIPDHLNEDAQACAEHVIKNFSAKHITSLDSYVLAVFAAAWAWHKAAVHIMSAPDFEPVVTRIDKHGNEIRCPNPWFRIMNEQARMMLQTAPKLFLTPRDRHILEGVGQDKQRSKFDGLLGQTESSDSLSN